MSVVQITDCNEFARLVDWVNELGLGSKTYGNNEVRVSNTVGVVGVNLLAEVVAGLTSGGATVDLYICPATGPTLGSPDKTVTLATTVVQEMDAPTTDTNRYFAIRVTAGGGGCVFAKNKAELKDEMPAVHGVRQGYHEAVGGFNKVPTTAAYVPLAYTAQ